MTHQPSPDAVVVGGGVIGLGIAWRAALAGMTVTAARTSRPDTPTRRRTPCAQQSSLP